MVCRYLTSVFVLLTLLGCSYQSEEDAMKSCVKWGNQGVSVRSYKHGLTSHNRVCIYDKEHDEVIGYEKDKKNAKGSRFRVKSFRY